MKLKTKRRLPGREETAAVYKVKRGTLLTLVLSGYARERKMYHERKTKATRLRKAIQSMKRQRLKMFQMQTKKKLGIISDSTFIGCFTILKWL